MNLLDRKMEYWEHQLLDLGKRNKMINYRETKRTTMKLLEPSYSELYKRIALNEEILTFQRAVDRETDIRVFSILSLLENLSSPIPVTIGDIRTEGDVLDRQRTLKNLRAKARLAQEEQGINILYLCFGFLEWKDGKGASAQWIKSPLILVPAVLSLDALNAPFTLKKHEDDIVANPTLEYYLKTEYGIDLPAFDADKDSLDDYLKQMEEIADQRGWRILRETSLGLLSFLKITMYHDLIRNRERIRQNPVIRAMAGDNADVNSIPEHLQGFALDSIRPDDSFQVMSADSSQQEAILYSKNNVSFVMQGPPGTGKSQTITNIIAEALGEGKKVLFVSEKMAALEVVYRRLQEAHLADFCLPLHSYKANKKDILEQIGANMTLKQTRVKDDALHSLNELMMIREELNHYAEELHVINPELNISCYEAYSKLEALKETPTFAFSFVNPLEVSQAKLQSCLNLLQKYALSLDRMRYPIENHPWNGLASRAIGFGYIERMRQALETLDADLDMLLGLIGSITECDKKGESLRFRDIPDYADGLLQIGKLPSIPNHWLEESDLAAYIADAREAERLNQSRAALQDAVMKTFHPAVLRFDCNMWREKLISLAKEAANSPFMPTESSDALMQASAELSVAFAEMKNQLLKASAAFASLNELLGTKLKANAYHQHTLIELYMLLSRNVVLPERWFSGDLEEIKALVLEAREIAEERKIYEEALLLEWKPEILSLDYSPILTRYESDYTSFFRIFNRQYSRDKKLIQTLAQDELLKLEDDVAVYLLGTLKEYHEKGAWFEENQARLSDALSIYDLGEESDWSSILDAIAVAKRIIQLPLGGVPQRLTGWMSTDHQVQTESMERLLSAATEAFCRVRNEASRYQLPVPVDTGDFDSDAAAILAERSLTKLNTLTEHYRTICPFLKRQDSPLVEIYGAIESLNDLKQTERILASGVERYQRQFGELYRSTDTEWNGIVSLLEQLQMIKRLPSCDLLRPVFNASEERKREFVRLAEKIGFTYRAGAESYEWICSQFSDDAYLQELDLYALRKRMAACCDTIDDLENWVDYQEAKEDCNRAGLSDFIRIAEDKKQFSELDRVFLKGFYYMWLGAVCDKLTSVRRFRRNVHDDKIQKFVKLDELQLLIAQMRIREKLIESLPSTNRMLRATDEVAILNKELGKKRNIMPLRKLFRLIPNLLLRLKPCLMMSPLSVSYFLETEAYHFDLVIFDEASQIFPEDAIGAIFRGAQVIIAGDSKQLPPTNFFASATNNLSGEYDTQDDDYDEVVSDSILEESAAVLPNRTLLWHYRSKHESLIAFSNREIYKNALITFPNSVNHAPDMGVEYVYVEDGCYDRGGRKNNVREAEECVRLVAEHIENHPDRSLGVIAFSESQQATIENAIVDFRERNPQFEWFFDENREEPFFVKNLENVQGDERDTILFSICYGKDKSGAMYMNFGPVGHSGGERRLNVAITRAKCNVKLIGSILPSDIDLDRAKSDGARMLRMYIDYARKGTAVFDAREKYTTLDEDDSFVDVITAFLEQRGYRVQRQIGCSDYKLDIGVVDPENEDAYIAGIECDGLSYIQARTARDRDHLRRSILRNMGWNLYRVWSTEWVRNPEKEGEALLAFLQSAVTKCRTAPQTPKRRDAETQTIAMDAIATETEKKANPMSESNPYGFSYYKEANWWDTKHSDGYDNLTRISENLCYILSVEQPMHMELLYKRMGPSFTTGKATEAVKRTIDEAIVKRLNGRVVIDEDRFIRLLPLTPISPRIPKEYDTPRPIEYIHTEEVAAAMLRILERAFGITKEDLMSECARVFGYERKGPKIKAKMESAVSLLTKEQRIRMIDGKVQLIGE